MTDKTSGRPGSAGMPKGFNLLIAAQFMSALADNALLIVAIAVLEWQGYPGWWAPLLKFAFTLSYVFLAPFVGPLADAVPKARLMAWMNGVKIAGVLVLMAGLHPVAAFAVVGLGAAAYAPAKYGLVTELVKGDRLVAANGWIEITVVCAALLGTVLGGGLIAELWLDTGLAGWMLDRLAFLGVAAADVYGPSLVALLGMYTLAALLNLGIPESGASYPPTGLHLGDMVQDFRSANRGLWHDAEGGRLSLAVTTLFWGVGATLQFAVLRWASDRLDMPLDQATLLQAAVALGVIAGAAIAGRWFSLATAARALPAGVLLGLLIAVTAWLESIGLAAILLAVVGAAGGMLVVPLNALLQHRGAQLLTAGRSIAVQGFNENLSILGMLATYSALLALDIEIDVLMSAMGLAIAAYMGMALQRAQIAAKKPPCD